MKFLIQSCTVIILLLAFNMLNGQTPPSISIQGQLKDATGSLAADGTYEAIFNLYDSFSGGASNWTETATIECIGGIYSHELGSVTPLEATVFSTTQYLGVRIGATEARPRTELTYAPYTFASNTALLADKVICSGAVGDVKYSIYNPTKFAEVNGDCWIPMDGRNIANTKLSTLIGSNFAPDASGLFLRAQEYSGNNDPDRTTETAAATLQNDEVQGHNHTGSLGSGGNHTHTANRAVQLGSVNTTDGIGTHPGRWSMTALGSGTSNAGGKHTHTITLNNTGQTETRPVNMNLYVYIRVE